MRAFSYPFHITVSKMASLAILFAVVVAFSQVGSAMEWRASDAPLRSNILLMLVDDVGYGDFDYGDGTHTSPSLTPNIKEFATAENSVHFRRFYSGGSMCSPTRSSMLTGRTPTRECIITVEENAMPQVMNTSTTASYARSQGYLTGFFGKWHVGSLTSRASPDCQPSHGGSCTQGYILYNNTLCCDGRDAYVPVMRPIDLGFTTALATPQVAPAGTANCGCVGTVPGAGSGCLLGHYNGSGHSPASQPWLECDQYFASTADGTDMLSVQMVTPEDDAEYLADNFLQFAQAAVAAGKPFFAQISFHHNHIPYLAPQKYRDLYPMADDNHKDYYGGLSAVDAQVGRIRAALRTMGVAGNTLVALTSDNGPELNVGGHGASVFENPGDNGGRTGRKRALTEGGIRVAGVVEYPPLVRQHRVEPGFFPASTNDFLPTLLDITGATRTHPAWPLDGVSLLPVLAGAVANRTAPIGWYSITPWYLGPPETTQHVACMSRPQHALPPSFPSDFATPFNQQQLAWTEGVHKLFACSDTPKDPSSWRFSLYDVVADEREQNDLWPSLHPTLGDAMFTRFHAWQQSVKHSVLDETRCKLGGGQSL